MTPRLLAHPMAITGESPLWDPRRNCLWWIDIQAQRLLCTRMDGATTAQPTPFQPGFVALAESGRLVLGLETGLFTFDPESGTWLQQSDTEADRPTVRLNDGKPDVQGRLWFGSMDMTGTGACIGRLYRRDPDGKIVIIREGVGVANAMVPSERRGGIWLADTPLAKLEFLPDRPGAESETVLEFENGAHPDGACLDVDGNLWIAMVSTAELLHLDDKARVLDRIALPVSRPTMPILGGPDGRTLFVTCQRRFLSAMELDAEPWAGGLLAIDVMGGAGPVHSVSGL